MFYLKKIVVSVEDEVCQREVTQLLQKLKEECPELEIMMEMLAKPEAGYCSAQADFEDCLWLTDSATKLAELSSAGQAVLVILHERNRDKDLSAAGYACENPCDLDRDYLEKVYRRYHRIPWDILETERCRLRETTEEDVEAFWAIYEEPAITRYTEGLYPTKEKERQYIREYIDHVYFFYGMGVWTVLLKETGEIIGRIGLSFREGYEEPELGFVIGLPWQKKGYALEVCREVLGYAKEEMGFDTVQAFVRPDNRASVRLCEKLGMKQNGNGRIDGVLHQRFQISL